MSVDIKECVGCGYCCMKAQCGASLRLHGSGLSRCPELIWDNNDNRYICKLMRVSGDIGFRYRQELFAGAGCCCGLNTWRNDIRNRDANSSAPEIEIPEIMQHFLSAMASEFMGSDKIFFILQGWMKRLIKSGMPEEEAKQYAMKAAHYIQQQRSSMVEGFMG